MPVIHIDPETMGGVPVFRGTRVPLDNLFDALEHGRSIDDFVESFPTVTREQAIAALRDAHSALVSRI
jgi:uncharacterized protein (DUF433 family)